MSKRNKQYLTLLGLIGVTSALILLVFSMMMPQEPQPVFLDQNENHNAVDPLLDPRKNVTIVLDPGHGGYDEGSQSAQQIKEKDINLEISLLVKDILEENNFQIVMTRDSDTVSWPSDNVKDLQTRLDIAEKANALALVSIHCNFSEEDGENISGSEVYVNKTQSDSVNLANAINAQLAKLAPDMPNREIKTGVLHLLTYNKVPSVIVEMGFLSNSKDTRYLSEKNTQDLMASAIAKGIMDYYELNK